MPTTFARIPAELMPHATNIDVCMVCHSHDHICCGIILTPDLSITPTNSDSRMPYTLSIDTDHQMLEVRYHGVVAIAQRVEAWRESKPLLRDSGIRRVMIDLLHAVPAQEPLNAYSDFAAMLLREPLLLASRTAFVAPPAHPINHMVEVLTDARHYPYSRFADRESALAWLLGNDPPDGLGTLLPS